MEKKIRSNGDQDFRVGDLQFDPGRASRLGQGGTEHHHGVAADLEAAEQAVAFFGADCEGDLQAFAFAGDARAIGQLGVHRFEKSIGIMGTDAGLFAKSGGQFFGRRRVDITKFDHKGSFRGGAVAGGRFFPVERERNG